MTTYGSLCTGTGRLDVAVESVFGCEMAWYAETDKDACKVLARHFPGVVNLGDLTTVDWSEVEAVDLICAGYPCQPFSTAGKRKGFDDHRDLWLDVARAVGALRPRIVVLENVANHLRLGFDRTLGDLAAMGFDARWGLVRASDVGCCHRRERLFAIAHADDDGWRLQPVPITGSGEATLGGDAGAGALADAHGEGRSADQRPQRVRGTGGCGDAPAPDADGPTGRRPRRSGEAAERPEPVERSGRRHSDNFPWGRYEPAIARHERIYGPAPWPVVEGTRSLSGDFTAWMQCMPEGWLDGISNTAKKRLAGNAVVAPQAELALRLLLDGWEVEG